MTDNANSQKKSHKVSGYINAHVIKETRYLKYINNFYKSNKGQTNKWMDNSYE
jgi:hypothetical protein